MGENLENLLETLDTLLRRINLTPDECCALTELITANHWVRGYLRSADCLWPLNTQMNVFDVPCTVLGQYHEYCKTTPLGARHAALLDKLDTGVIDKEEMAKSKDKGCEVMIDAISNRRCDLILALLPYVPPNKQISQALLFAYEPNLITVAPRVLAAHPMNSGSIGRSLHYRELATAILPMLLSRGPKIAKSVQRVSDLIWLKENGLCLDDPRLLEYFIKSRPIIRDETHRIVTCLVSHCPPSPLAVRIAKSTNYYYALLASMQETEALYTACNLQYRSGSPAAEYLDSRLNHWTYAQFLDRDSLRSLYQCLKEHAPAVFEDCMRHCLDVDLLIEVADDWIPGSWYGCTLFDERICKQYKSATAEQCLTYLTSWTRHKKLVKIAAKRLAQLNERSLL
jgi:hypothetical protein